jgi:hypothetical protein
VLHTDAVVRAQIAQQDLTTWWRFGIQMCDKYRDASLVSGSERELDALDQE